MADISKARLDVKKRDGGKWFPWFEDVEVKIASIQSRGYQKYMRMLAKKRRGMRRSKMTEEESDRLTKIGLAKHIILNWRGLTDQGKPVECNEEKALEYLNDEGLCDFYQFVLECAGDVSEFQQEALEDQAGN